MIELENENRMLKEALQNQQDKSATSNEDQKIIKLLKQEKADLLKQFQEQNQKLEAL